MRQFFLLPHFRITHYHSSRRIDNWPHVVRDLEEGGVRGVRLFLQNSHHIIQSGETIGQVKPLQLSGKKIQDVKLEFLKFFLRKGTLFVECVKNDTGLHSKNKMKNILIVNGMHLCKSNAHLKFSVLIANDQTLDFLQWWDMLQVFW